MRQTIFLFAVTAAALATPQVERQQIALVDSHEKSTEQNAVQAWWDALPNADRLFSPIQDRIAKGIQRSNLEGLLALIDGERDEPHPRPPHGGHGRHGHHGHHGDPEKTIYELIKESKHTTKFAKLVEEHDDIKQLLQDTKHNYTLFVPTDRAFRHVHGHHGKDSDDDDDDEHDHKPPKEFILALLKYHLTPGLYPLHRVRASNTLPSSFHPSALSTSPSDHHNPQRIRVFSPPLLPLPTRLNFHARLIAGDFPAKNGLIHALDSLLIPPPNQTTIIRLLPSQFSTLALALETTGLGEELDGLHREGGATLFAPTNRAWRALGPRVNAFLFSERGKKYLKALVKYHVAVNETLYSDAYYSGGGGKEEEVVEGGDRDYWHVDLTSLLGGKPISVDVKRWKRFVSIVVNGFVRVVVRDGVADDGVVQVVSRVLIPPHEHHGPREEEEEMSLEELKNRLEPYLEETSGGREDVGDL